MANKRAKRFDEGGDVEPEKSKMYKAEPAQESTGLKKESFKEAFARSKKSGDKTFEFNGKKYTTETAKPKASGPDESSAETGRLTRAAATRPAAEPGLEESHPEDMLGGMGLKAAARVAKTVVQAGERKAAQKATESLAAANRREALKESARSGTRAGQRASEDAADMGRMGSDYMKKGGKVKARSASSRADGCAIRGKTRA